MERRTIKAMGFFAWLLRKKPKKLKLGLALGSGGAKGFAHLGAIRAFEENGIEFDVIAGTSIGSIVGAFYANGYTSTDIFELLKAIDFSDVKNIFMSNMDGSGLYGVIENNLGPIEFSDLKKPFKAIATELISGEEKVFDSGNVAIALCASSSMPPFFKPVVIDNQRYVDGAFTNSVPADVVREMGADYVVGIDLRNHEAKPSLLSRIFPTYKSKVEKPWEKGYEYSDIVLNPDLRGFDATSFLQGAKMYEMGYKCAIDNMGSIKAELVKLKKIKGIKN